MAIVSSLMGKCSTCWQQGEPTTLVSAPPMSRCVDMKACEERRTSYAKRIAATERPIIEAPSSFEKEAPSYIIPSLVTRPAFVETIRKGHVHYFRRVRKFAKNEHGVEFLVREDLELVPDVKRATLFEPSIANQLAREWHAVAKEKR